jgi:hypothetical protein
MDSVILGITRVPETKEYRVFWKQGNKDDEAKACYADDPEDAVNTLLYIFNDPRQTKGYNVRLSDAKYTRDLVSKYGK